MGVTARVAEMIAAGGQTLDAGPVAREASRLLAIEAPLSDISRIDDVVANVVGMGPLTTLMEDESITDILVNGYDEIWVDRGDTLQRVESSFDNNNHLMATIERVLASLGVRIDRNSPMADGRLADGSRIHVSIPPASVDHPVVAIRRFSPTITDFTALVERGGATRSQVETLSRAVVERESVIVSGATGAGKTTLLNLMATKVPPEERIVTIEDAAELRFPGHVVRLEARPPNAEGVGEVTIRQLLRSALRLRPDRIILGEVRGAEALDLITALNTGHRGSMSTVHANSADEAMWRLETLALLDGVAAPEAVRRQLYAAVDMVVQVGRIDGHRAIESISRIGADSMESS